jgi:hypothetical protein
MSKRVALEKGFPARYIDGYPVSNHVPVTVQIVQFGI